MILLWLLCVSLILGGLLASLANQEALGGIRLQRMRTLPVPAPAPCAWVRLLARGNPGRDLFPPEIGSRAGPPGRQRGRGWTV